MKKLILISMVVLVSILGLNQVNASYFSDYLPGGKNYLDPNNFEITVDEMYTIDPIRVKSNMEYTISIPGTDFFRTPLIDIESNNEVYTSGLASNSLVCSLDNYFSTCTFTVNALDDYISIHIQDIEISHFIDFYGFINFQLEEGNVRTTFEEYIVPLIDTESPEFSGTGAYVMAYYETTSLEQIIDEHIVVIDEIDGDVSENIQIFSDEYTSNIGIVGEYLVELRAYDSSLNYAVFNLTIIIKDETLPEISGPLNVVVNVNDLLTIEEIIISNYLATDENDGTLIINSEIDNYSLNKDILGTYEVMLSAEDQSANYISENITITVIDVDYPFLQGSNVVNVYLDNPKTIDEIYNNLDIADNYDSTEAIGYTVIEDGYSSNSNIIGSYETLFLINDSSSNSQEISIYINVIDNVSPVITGPSLYSFSYVEDYTIDDFISLLSISDNYDDLTSDNLVVTQNTYTSRTEEVGEYQVIFRLFDNSGNETQFTMLISVVDDRAPIIYADNFLITLSGTISFNEEDAVRMLISNHEIPDDEYAVEVIVDEYSTNAEVPGNYQYSILLTNNQGETFQKDFIVKVPQGEESKISMNLLARNIVVYSVTITIVGFVIVKNKKH